MFASLLADRFLRTPGGCVVDVSSATYAAVRVSRGDADEHRWMEQCATLLTLRHPHLVSLLDYGHSGSRERFEAFERVTPWGGRDRHPRVLEARGEARAFLERLDLPPHLADGPAVNWRGLPAFIPATVLAARKLAPVVPTSRTVRGSRSFVRHGSPDLGLVLQPCSALRGVVEWLDDELAQGPRVLVLEGPPGSGLRTALTLAAREARVHGFVPLSSRWFAPDLLQDRYAASLRRLVSTRHVLVIHDDTDRGRHDVDSGFLGRILLRLGAEGRPSSALLIGCRSAVREWPAIEIAPLDDARIEAMLRAAELPRGATPGFVRGLARRYGGRPGQVLSQLRASVRRPSGRLATAVAESAPPYTPRRVDTPENLDDESLACGHIRARRGAVEGSRLAATGRHAAAERLLRESLGGLVRRGDHAAGEAAIALARLLMTRGRLVPALEVLAFAERALERPDTFDVALRVAVLKGHIRTDLGQFDLAERTLRGAWQASGPKADARGAAAALARCLFWQEKFDDARQLLVAREQIAGEAATDPDIDIMASITLARIELARRDVHAAGLASLRAFESATALCRPFELAAAARSRALVHAASGDLEAMTAKVRLGLDAARRAHTPLMAIRLRAVEVRALAAAQRYPEARRRAQPLRRLRSAAMAPPLAAQVRLALDEADGSSSRSAAGKQTLDSFNGSAREPLIGTPRRAPVIDDVIDVLYLCQHGDDEPSQLGRVGGMVRERTRAASVAFLAVAGEGLSVVASCGQQPGAWRMAERAVQSGTLIRAARHEHGIEAAAPIRLGQCTVGALACRWTAEGPPDAARAEALLSAAAVACAPWVQSAVDRRIRPVEPIAGGQRLLGISRAAADLRHAIARAAAAPFPVLVEGESGSGKELVAHAIHTLGPRREQRFCAVNCAALPDELLESELFGHARGAFTGASNPRPGLFEEAHRGTLLLDEIGELSARAQAKLLRVLQESEIRRVGENHSRHIDVRVIAATNRSLTGDVDAGRFRRDLLYRLDVVRISVPPLRSRIEDIAVLARHFWDDACRKLGSRAMLSASTMATLARHDWPGNVRELQNVMAALAVSVPPRGLVSPSALPRAIATLVEAPPGATLEDARRAFETRFVRAALARAGGRRGPAARELGVSRQGLAKLMARLDIDNAEPV